MANVIGLDHVSILVSNAEASLAFYQDLLGLKLLERPALGFAGYWLDVFDGQSIHLMELPNPDEEYSHQITRPDHGGKDFHFALRVESVEQFKVLLVEKGIRFTESQSGRKALFVRDIDSNAFELFER